MTLDDIRVARTCALTIAAAMLEAGDRSAPEVVEPESALQYVQRANDLYRIAKAYAEGESAVAVAREINARTETLDA